MAGIVLRLISFAVSASNAPEAYRPLVVTLRYLGDFCTRAFEYFCLSGKGLPLVSIDVPVGYYSPISDFILCWYLAVRQILFQDVFNVPPGGFF